MECGTKVGATDGSAVDFVATLVSLLFYLSIAALVTSPFLSTGPSFVLCLLTSCALLFVMRTAKDSSQKVRKR